MLSLPPDCLALILNTMSFMGANFVVEWNSTNEVGVADCMTNQGAHGGLSSDGSSDTSVPYMAPSHTGVGRKL